MSFFRSLLRTSTRLYRQFFQHRLDPHTRETVDVLQAVPMLGHLSSGTLYEMAGATHRRSYRRGETLYYEGDPGLGLYIVESGRIRLRCEDEGGRMHELREVGANEMFGVFALLGDFRRFETAETLTEAQVLGFFRPDLKNVMRRSPRAGAQIVMAFGRHVAAQHVELIRILEEQEGRTRALESYVDAAKALDAEAPPLQ